MNGTSAPFRSTLLQHTSTPSGAPLVTTSVPSGPPTSTLTRRRSKSNGNSARLWYSEIAGCLWANESDESVINLVLEDFVRRHRLQDLSGSPLRLRLSDLRPTAMKRELRRGRDIASVQRLANHRFVSTTVRYVDDVLSEEATRAIAAAQESLYERPDAMRVSVQIGLAERPGLACSDPTNGRGPGASVGQLCPNWLAELLNPNLIVPGEPKYVARLLQVRQQLRASQERMLARRFELLYRPCLDALESALGHFEDPTLLEQAHELVSTLPPLIRLEIA